MTDERPDPVAAAIYPHVLDGVISMTTNKLLEPVKRCLPVLTVSDAGGAA